MSILGTRKAYLSSEDETSAYLEWTVDGVSLRALYCHGGPDDGQITWLTSDARDDLERTESLRRLRGEAIPPPSFEPVFERTRLDRLLHLRGTPVAATGTAYQDGRVALLLCYCTDLDCASLTAWVVVTESTVVWRDIAWQVTYRPHVPYDADQDVLGPRDLAFDRTQYVNLIDALLAADWSRGLPDLD